MNESPVLRRELRVKLPVELHARLQDEADAREVGVTYIVRKALEHYLGLQVLAGDEPPPTGMRPSLHPVE